jgi:hypothetical protein
MKDKYILKYSALIFTIVLTFSIAFAGCRIASATGEKIREAYEEQQDVSYDELKERAYHSAVEVVMGEYPGSEPIVDYSPDKVIEEAPGVYIVTVEGRDGIIYHCALRYYEDGDMFDTIEIVQEGHEPGSEEEYIADQEQKEDLPEEEIPQGEATPEEQPQETRPEEKAPENKPEQTPQQQLPTEQEIKERAFHAAQADVLSSYPNAVFESSSAGSCVKALEANLYQVFIGYKVGVELRSCLYMVRYDHEKDKMFIPFKKDYQELANRARNQAKYYIENNSYFVTYCNVSIAFDESYDLKPISTNIDKPEIFPIPLKFQCERKESNKTHLTGVECVVYTRYDIIDDSFKDFEEKDLNYTIGK